MLAFNSACCVLHVSAARRRAGVDLRACLLIMALHLPAALCRLAAVSSVSRTGAARSHTPCADGASAAG